MKKKLCTAIAALLVVVLSAVPAMAVTPAFQWDKVDFELVKYSDPDFVDNEPASGNKTRVKGVSASIEMTDWGYIHVKWKGKSMARAYQIEITEDKTFTKVYRGRTPLNSATRKMSFASRPKSGDTYYIRVRAVYKNDKVGPWSKTAKITKK